MKRRGDEGIDVQVAAERGELMSERKKETDKYRLAEHEENYKALLLDLVRFYGVVSIY